ncbi:hypothetical protein K2Z84_03755 [Candidatus Binatia bacterium]|nr:hypothetical protein [Candidatus Binatia bacterium]
MDIFAFVAVTLVSILPAYAAAPDSLEVTCDVDRTAFRSLSRSTTEVTFRLWDAEAGGNQCGSSHTVQMIDLVVFKEKTDSFSIQRPRNFSRIQAVLGTAGDSGTPIELCSGGDTWVDVTLGATTLTCAFSDDENSKVAPPPPARRRLNAVAFAGEAGTGGGSGIAQIDTGPGLQGGPITSTGTISLDAPTCTGTQKLTWNGSTLSCATDATGGGDQLTILQAAYPVGSIYMNALNSANPSVLLGFGTWVAFGEGRVLVGKAPSGTFQTAGATGGEENHTLTAAEMPPHTHGLSLPMRNWNGWNGSDNFIQASTNGGGSGTFTGNTDSAGSGSPHNNLQPYIVIYMWQRAA